VLVAANGHLAGVIVIAVSRHCRAVEIQLSSRKLTIGESRSTGSACADYLDTLAGSSVMHT
jgi:hypothetical protein